MNFDAAFLKTGSVYKLFEPRPLDGPDARTHAHTHTRATGSAAARRPRGRAYLARFTVPSIDGTLVDVFVSMFQSYLNRKS